MVNMTLAVPEELSNIMKKHSTTKWTEVAREAMWARAKKLELMDKLLSKSTLTEKDAIELGKKIKKGVAKKHKL
jgi:hypothetical protein